MRGKTSLPLECRIILAIATLLVRRPGRRDWRARSLSHIESWWFYNAGLPGARSEAVRETLRSVREGIWGEADAEEAGRNFRRVTGSPAFLAAVVLLPLTVIGMLSGGFRETSAMLRARQRFDERVVFVTNRSALAGYASGVTPSRFLVWSGYQRSLESFGAYAWGETKDRTLFAKAQPAVFGVLGLGPEYGRVLDPRVCRDCGLARDRRDVGKTVQLDGRNFRLAAALPDDFWLAAARPRYWIPLDLGHLPDRLGVVARMKPGVSVEAAERDLGAGIAPIGHFTRETAMFYAVCLFLALALALVRVTYDRAFWAHASGRLRNSWRFWTFCLAKTVVVAAIVIIAAVEIRYGVTATPTGARDPVVMLFASWPVLLVFGAAFWWSWADQRARCRTCLRRLDLPVHMGVLGASLFDPIGIESICPAGHGALYEPDTPTSDAAWITLDEFFSTSAK